MAEIQWDISNPFIFQRDRWSCGKLIYIRFMSPAYTLNLYMDSFSNTSLCVSFPHSPTRGSTIKTSRINVPTATVPTQTLRRCRSTCQHTPSKTLRPTAAACAAGHTPQWVNHKLPACYLTFSQSVFWKVADDITVDKMVTFDDAQSSFDWKRSCFLFAMLMKAFASCANMQRGRVLSTENFLLIFTNTERCSMEVLREI